MDLQEAFELTVSWLTISVAFAWNLDPMSFFASLPIYMLAVGTAFIFHELSHRYVARKLGYPARFVIWREGLILALLFAVMTNGGFVFAAPGAVYIFGNPNTRESGLISVAGPLSNLLIAYLFLFLAVFDVFPVLTPLFLYISRVNTFIGLFNLLPIYPLDGSKVLPWNPALYTVVLLAFAPLFLV